jgi:hypothetical protein
MRIFKLFIIFLLFPVLYSGAESFRTRVEGRVEVTPARPSGNSVSVGIEGAVLIALGSESRFLRGIEIEITAPQAWLRYQGAIVMAMYSALNPQSPSGVADIDGTRIAYEPLPARLQIIYQIPVRQAHGLRTTTNITVPTGIIQPASFPILFRAIPAIKGLSDELENLAFSITARPIISDEGAVRIVPRYPPQLRNRPFTVLIDDNVVNNISEQLILKEGEHHLVVRSDDYRNESRRFVVERAKVIDLTIELQDPTPIVIFEAPENAQIFLNNRRITQGRDPITVEPGNHEIKFQIGDYTVIRTLTVQRGKTYRVALAVDVSVNEED